MALTDAGRVPSATFRVQLHHDFTFRDLLNEVDYLHRLGISDVYLSPIFTASPGSSHGYDVNDYLTINPELGGEEAFLLLSERLRGEAMGILIDIVPNHMGIPGPLNTWWQDVLENGRDSAYADFFDIRWQLPGDRGKHRVLVPMLADQYGLELEQGKIRLIYDNAFYLTYWEYRLPVTAKSYGVIIGPLLDDSRLTQEDRAALHELGMRFLNLPAVDSSEIRGEQHARTDKIVRLKKELALCFDSRPELRLRLGERLSILNGVPGEAASFNELDQIIEAQHYRIARWKTGVHEINYRRFFAIDSLVGIREENPIVFDECHRLVKRLVAEGRVTGLRIDHLDGLRLPADYLRRLQTFERPASGLPLCIYVEKILARNESLSADWLAHGTTGYEFILQLASLLVDPLAESQLNETYARFTGEITSYPDVVYGKKRLILDELFANEVTRLGTDLAEIIAEDRKWKDLTRGELVVSVREVMANLSVYRTYRSSGAPLSPVERTIIEDACTAAIERNPSQDPSAFELVRKIIVGDYPQSEAPGEFRDRIVEWVLTFQQYTGAVMTKGVEDTAFYTYCRFIAYNEIGGDPGLFVGSLAAFHTANQIRLADAPHSLLTDSTHDTKMSADVRARLYVLSETPEIWDKAVGRWHALNERHRVLEGEGPAPDVLDEYRLYQTLIGVWPLEPAEINDDFRARLKLHVRKAVDEAKRHTSILKHNETYQSACQRFLEAILDPARSAEFLADFTGVVCRFAQAGLTNSIAQVILKITVPGVPDLYQGNEIWDFSLVDPDNRRYVDFAKRRALLAAVERTPPAKLLEHWKDGGIKLRVTQVLLTFRRSHPLVFSRGTYQPLFASGLYADHVVAFLREESGIAIVVIVPRLSSSIGTPPIGIAWDDTAIKLPSGLGRWRDLMTHEVFPESQAIKIQHLMASLPFAMLTNRFL